MNKSRERPADASLPGRVEDLIPNQVLTKRGIAKTHWSPKPCGDYRQANIILPNLDVFGLG